MLDERVFVLTGQLEGLAGDHDFFLKAEGAQLSSAEHTQELAAQHRLTHGDKGNTFWFALLSLSRTVGVHSISSEDFGPTEAMTLLCL